MLFNTFEQYVVCWCIYYCMCVVGGVDLWCSTLHSTIISKQSVLLVEETEVPGKNHRLVSSTPRHQPDSNSQLQWWQTLTSQIFVNPATIRLRPRRLSTIGSINLSSTFRYVFFDGFTFQSVCLPVLYLFLILYLLEMNTYIDCILRISSSYIIVQSLSHNSL